jgi:chorismate synthase
MTSGMPVIFRAAMKPTPSIFIEQDSVDITSMTNKKLTIHGRHDPCVAVRAVPVFEAAAAIAVLDLLLDNDLETK